MEPRGKIIVILGPTSSGKSDIAIKLAQKFDGEIVSADSRQIYRGMDIGTGKVTKQEQKLVKHWMLDIVSPNTEYNVAKYKKRAQKILEDILKRGKLPIICGGTGFWIKALVDNIDFPEVKPDPALRNMLSNKSADELFGELKKIDPERARTIDPKNKVRLIRAIEICKAIGKVPIVSHQSSVISQHFLQIGIDLPKETLNERIMTRLEKRFRQGMVDEVKNLHSKNKVSWKKLESFGLEYYWISLYLQNKLPLEEAKEKLYYDIIHYAKRQMTWFRKDSRIVWLENYEDIESTAVAQLIT